MKHEKNSFISKVLFSLLVIVISWLSIGIGFTMSGNPGLSGLLFLGGIILFFSSGIAFIYFLVKAFQN